MGNRHRLNGKRPVLRLHPGKQTQRHIYVGVTSDLVKRVHEHKSDWLMDSRRHMVCTHLVHYETVDDIESAIVREKQIKRWKRAWKVELIEGTNPDWRDLFPDLM